MVVMDGVFLVWNSWGTIDLLLPPSLGLVALVEIGKWYRHGCRDWYRMRNGGGGSGRDIPLDRRGCTCTVERVYSLSEPEPECLGRGGRHRHVSRWGSRRRD